MVVTIDIVELVGIEVTSGIVEEELHAHGVVSVKFEVSFVLFLKTVHGIGQVDDDLQTA